MKRVNRISKIVFMVCLAVFAAANVFAEPLTMWHLFQPDSPQDIALKKAIDEWNKANPDHQVEEEYIENESYKTKIRTAMAANEAPDLFFAWGAGFTKPFVEAGKVLALDEYLNDGTKDKIVGGGLSYQTYNGTTYGLPISVNVGTFYVNEELFQKHNVKIPETYDELITAIEAFRSKGVTPLTVGEKDRWPGMFYYNILALRTAGAELSNAALTDQASFNDPAFIQAADLLDKIVEKEGFESYAMALTRDESEVSFRQGLIPMYFNGSWLVGEFERDGEPVKGKIQVRPFPSVKGGQGKSSEFLGGPLDAFWASSKAKDKEVTVGALKFISERFAQHGWEGGTGLPAWKVTTPEGMKVNRLTQQIIDLLNDATGYVLFWDMFLPGEHAEKHKDLVAQIFSNNISPKQFASEMQSINEQR